MTALVAVGTWTTGSGSSHARKGKTGWTWTVKNPINNYEYHSLVIGKYVTLKKDLLRAEGNPGLQLLGTGLRITDCQSTISMAWIPCFVVLNIGLVPIRFTRDGYKLVQSPYLTVWNTKVILPMATGFVKDMMERISSGTGWGLKWDFIVVHESGHEWFGNNITCKDIADEWIHESFTNYSETLYTGFFFGKNAGDAYCIGTR